jgi:MFS transporter, ACS family, glucarate transporter
MTDPTRPTRVRYSILGLLCVMAMITYLDRAANSIAKDEIMAAVGRPVVDFFWVLSAFQIAYACFEVPTGYLGDRFRPRKTIIRLVLWWSFFMGLNPVIGLVFPSTVAVFGTTVFLAFLLLIGAEFLFGVGEAGAFPNITRALYNWFPATQRGIAQGTIWMSARLMGGFTPLTWLLLVELGGLSWRQAFWLFAVLAAVWCLSFYFWFRNHPHEHSATNQAERDHIEAGRSELAGHHAVPWGKIFTSRNMLALCAMYMVTNFNWYFIMYYLPGTFKAQFPDWNSWSGGKVLLALLGGAPMLVGMIGCLLGGVLTDRYVRRTGDRKWGRRLFAMLGYGMAGICYLTAGQFTHSLWVFAICVMLVGFFNDWNMGPSWAACQDVGRRYSAIVSGTMNMVGNLGAVLGIQATGRILRAYTPEGSTVPDPAGYTVLFTVYAAVYAFGVLTWLFIDASKPIPLGDTVVPDQSAEDYGERS